jgi:hypothetical protein
MNPIVKKEWLAALRSGKYEQGTRYLCNIKEQYCCLGVLVDACFVVDWTHYESDDAWRVELGDAFLPERILIGANLDHEEVQKLVKMNDIEGLTFKQIATWIEKNL